MSNGLEALLIGASTVLALVAVVWALRNRAAPVWLLGLAAVVEAVVVAVVVQSVARLVSGHRPHEMVTYVGYLIALLLLVPGGVVFAVVERTRFGTAILGVAALVVPVLIARLHQVLRT